jgi:hypothetical protein
MNACLSNAFGSAASMFSACAALPRASWSSAGGTDAACAAPASVAGGGWLEPTARFLALTSLRNAWNFGSAAGERRGPASVFFASLPWRSAGGLSFWSFTSGFAAGGGTVLGAPGRTSGALGFGG